MSNFSPNIFVKFFQNFFQTEREIRASTFQFELTDAASDIQFPANADPVLNVIYKLRGLSPAQEAAGGGPQPQQPPPHEAARFSPSASSAASNSDSGIGYKDEALHPQVRMESLLNCIKRSAHESQLCKLHP